MYLTRALQPPLLAGPPRKAEEVVYSRVRSAVDMFMDLERGTAGKETIVENTERRELCGAIYALKEFLAQQVKVTGKNDWLRCSSMTCNNYRNSPFANGCARKDKHSASTSWQHDLSDGNTCRKKRESGLLRYTTPSRKLNPMGTQ